MTKRKNDPQPARRAAKSKVQGEGNVAADRRYRAGVASTLETKDVEELAKLAHAALEGSEGDELRAAEKRGRSRQDPRP